MITLRCVARLLFPFFLLFLAAGAFPTSAQPLHHAALIVDFGDGRVVVRIVAFAEETISGVDLLQRSGLDVAVLVNLGGGAALCAVEGVGCAPTPQECFCQCHGNPCRYWSYFHLQAGAWVYAGMGAAGRTLHDGDVDGWVWGDGRTAPPLLTWDDIWAQNSAPQPTPPLPPTATRLPPATAVPRPTPAPTASPATASLPGPGFSPVPSAIAPTRLPAPPTALAATAPLLPVGSAIPLVSSPDPSPVTLATSTPAPAGAGEGPPWGTAAAFGGLVLVLLVLGLWVRRRK